MSEHSNGLVCQCFPTGADFVAAELNGRPP